MNHGPASLLSGVMALGLALVSWHVERVRIPGSAHILNWLDAHGLVSPPQPYGLSVVAEPSLLLLTDGGAIQLIQVLAWCLSFIATAIALLAVHAKEDSLYGSGGVVLAFLALSLFNVPVAACLAFGTVAVATWLRKR